MSFGGGSSGGTTTSQVTPYAPAEPALAQILSEAGQLYNQGVGASGYVAPTQQTLQGLAAQEQLGTAAQQQLAATLGGQYLNPFLSPLLQKTAGDIATGVQSQFSAAGRTPGSPMSQQQIVTQVAQAALPLAFRQYETERGRQLGIASQAPSLVQTGQQLEALQRQQQLAPAQALQQYAGFVSPIATGLPTTLGSQQVSSNPLTTALGGAVLGSSIPGVGAMLGGGLGLLGGLL
jgi:hypothetical protein|tara:strand:+ start:2452 stop:3153 length:702 start_codon:yes stop_codon:yes gene_type:complete